MTGDPEPDFPEKQMSMEVMVTGTQKSAFLLPTPTKKYRVEEGNWAWMGDIGVI